MTPQEFRRTLEQARERSDAPVLLATHERPDGDAVSSISAAASVLTDNGFPARAILPGNVPDCYTRYVPEELVIRDISAVRKPELFITLDCSNSARIAAGGFPFKEMPSIINIDHHPDNEGFAPLALVNPKAAATAEILTGLFEESGFSVSKENATRLLLGIITDSGCFRFDNTTPETLETAARLIRKGADRHTIIVDAYSSREESLVRLEADLIANGLRTAFNGKVAWFVLTRALLDKYGVEVRNTENLIDAVRNIRGVEFAALLREEPDGFKVSLRTKNAPWSAGNVARRLNGGGHEMAAGGFIHAASIAEAEQILQEQIHTELKNHEKQTR